MQIKQIPTHELLREVIDRISPNVVADNRILFEELVDKLPCEITINSNADIYE